MIFSVGNLLVIGIVLVILTIYRQLDRNNRSLDRVRKYADKAKEELDKVVLERVQNLKDLAIELDIHQKAGKEILKRIQAIEDGLKEKFASTDSIAARIKEYDKVLVDLIEMTKRAEENIHRVKEESLFVDETAKKIKTLGVKVESQEGKMQDLVKRFEEINKNNLETVQEKVLSKTEESISFLETRIADATEKTDSIVVYLKTSEQKLREETSNIETRLKKSAEQTVTEISQRLSVVEHAYNERLEEAARKGEALETKALQRLKEHVEEKMRSTYKDLVAQLDTEKINFRSQIDTLEQRIYQQEGEMQKFLEEKTGEIQTSFLTTKQNLENTLLKFTEDTLQKTSTLEERIHSSDAHVQEFMEGVEGKIIQGNTKIETFGEQAFSRLDALAENFEKKRGDIDVSLHGELSSLKEEAKRIESTFEELKSNLAKNLDTLRSQMHGEVRTFDGIIKRTFQEEEEKILKQGEDLHTRVLQRLEDRLQEQEKQLSYRYGKIEEVASEIDNLETNLRVYMDRTRLRLQEDFTSFGKQLHEHRLQDQEDVQKEMARLRSAMAELEKGLADLKTRAYENVSEKLKVFEDEFFLDLKTRDQQMQSKFMEWQNKVDGALDTLMSEEAKERKRVEERYTQELSATLQDFQGRFHLQVETLNSEMEGFRKQTEYHIREFEKSLQRNREEMIQSIEEGRSSTLSSFSETFVRHQKFVKEEMDRFQKEYEIRLKGILESMEGQKRELGVSLENIKSDVILWKAKVQEDLKAGEAEVSNHFSGFKIQVSNTIGGLRDDFLRQKNDLIVATEEERKRLKEELATLGERINGLEDSLHTKTEEALEAFRQGYSEFEGEFHRKLKDLQIESEGKMKDSRSNMKDTQERFEALHQKLFGKLEESVKLLSLNFGEIEKKQRAFVEQTKIFDRADTLKQTLLEQMEQMKHDLQRIEEDRRELKETEAVFLRVKKLGEETTEKLARFTAEKRRMDSVEEDFKRLMAMSEGIELKLRQVATSEDGIQSVQANLRSLQSLQQDVEGRFERLEKKRKFLDLTMEGIDKNFQSLQDIERRIGSIEQELQDLPTSVQTLGKQLQLLSEGKVRAEETIQKVTQIDSLMKDLEGRASNLLKAREWLAKTETRLQELNKEAQDQVKLLGSLLKEGAKGTTRGEKGAPSLSARETVAKLAHQGWTVEQIATATKLSRGEVELILELSGKS